MPDFRLPDLGEGLTEAEIVSWHVGVGDEVQVDQIVVEVETAKAAVEVPIPFAGKVSALHAQVGQSVAVGAPLISVGAAVGFDEPGVVTAPAGMGAQATGESSGNVLIGYGTPPARPRRRRGRPAPVPARAASPADAATRPTASAPAAPTRSSSPASVPASAASRTIAVVSPLVRKRARDAGLDLQAITGTGPRGLIMRRDVEQAAAAPAPTRSDEQRIPLAGVRKLVADKLSRSRREIPEATVWVDVDATELLAARAAINARADSEPVSVLALLSRFVIAGLRRYPELNGRIENDELVLPSAVHLGFAAQTERGLVVPVVRGAHALTVRQLGSEIRRLTAAARDGRISPADLTGGTVTVNNYGVFGVDGSAAIINHPEVAIIGIGRIIDRPWVIGGELTVRKVTQLTLAFDHRACDGGTAGGFLRFIADCVESPVSVLADL